MTASYPNPEAPEPGFHSWESISPAKLREIRTSVKYSHFPEHILPMFVAEMDFPVAKEVRDAVSRCVDASDFGYLSEPGELAPAFSEFAKTRWGWEFPAERVRITTDVSVSVVEPLRLVMPKTGGKIGLSTPAYPGFFEMLQEFDAEVVEIPLRFDAGGSAHLDLAAIAAEFKTLNAFILCNPHNPHGAVFTTEELTELAQLATANDVAIIADEIHAPLVYKNTEFVPFGPIAEAADTVCFVGCSASKGWSIPGAKCAVVVGANERSARLLDKLPPEVTTRVSILGLHANIAAFRDGIPWLDRAIERIEANVSLFHELLSEQLPEAGFVPPKAGYLAWVDLRNTAIADDPWQALYDHGHVAFGDGKHFGKAGRGFVRVNLACSPETVREAVSRIVTVVKKAPVAR